MPITSRTTSMKGSSHTAAMMALSCFSEGRNTHIHEMGMMANVLRSLSNQVETTLKNVHLKVPVPRELASP